MGTGVGEAMLIGAITGAGTSAVTGGDPLKGALLGAVGGGAGAGIAGATAGATTGATAGTTTGTAAGTTAGTTAGATGSAFVPGGLEAASAADIAAMSGQGTGFTAANTASLTPPVGTPNAGLPTGTITYAPSNDPGFIPTGAAGAPSASLAQTSPAMDSGLNTSMVGDGGVDTVSSVQPKSNNFLDRLLGKDSSTSIPTPSTDDAKEGQKLFPSINELYGRNPVLMPAASGAVTSAAFNPFEPEEEEEEEYSGALKDFKYTRSGYTPYRAASGGLMDTAVARRLMGGGQLGSYSDGGQALQGPGDGMSDSIPGVIGGAQPARLADGEFVVPADVVSGIGNGSTDAGSRQLYAMMDKIREARTGRTKQAPEINPRRMMPA